MTINCAGAHTAARQGNERNKELIFKNWNYLLTADSESLRSKIRIKRSTPADGNTKYLKI